MGRTPALPIACPTAAERGKMGLRARHGVCAALAGRQSKSEAGNPVSRVNGLIQ